MVDHLFIHFEHEINYRSLNISCIVVGITGNVTIDKNGDRNADYSLLDMDPATGKFEVGNVCIQVLRRSFCLPQLATNRPREECVVNVRTMCGQACRPCNVGALFFRLADILALLRFYPYRTCIDTGNCMI